MRTSSLVLLALASCGDDRAGQPALAKVDAQQRATAGDDGRIWCARGGVPFARTCTVDREQRADGLVLTVRSTDGGFRRLLVKTDGRGVVAADGAEPARVRIVDANRIEVALGDDHYRLPATVRSANAAR